jgi:hypothetical protein
MSALNPGGSLLPLEQVVPGALAMKGLSTSSLIVQRRRCRIVPQTGPNVGSAGAGAGTKQINFVINEHNGLLDPASMSIAYNILTTGSNNEVPDDGHPFVRFQLNCGGQNLEDTTQAAKNTNVEVKLGTSQAFYMGAGSMYGFELLNGQLNVGAGVASPTVAQQQAYNACYGDVVGNTAGITSRTSAAASYPNPLGGEQRALPLGLLCGFARSKQYYPLNLGELNLTLFTGAAGEVMLQTGSTYDADFSLQGLVLEYDVCSVHPAYAALLDKMQNDPAEAGIAIPFESCITATAPAVAINASGLTENTITVSRATSNLLRSWVVFQPQGGLSSQAYPSQSCFGRHGTYRIQYRVGSSVFPQVPAEGTASIFAMSMMAYGSPLNETASVINRCLWEQTSVISATGTTAEGSSKFNWADSFIPCFGYALVKGEAEPMAIDGINLSSGAGSQLSITWSASLPTGITAATVQPTVGLVAVRVLVAQGGSVRVVGA